MTTTQTMQPGQLAAFDQAVAAYRDACHRFAHRLGGESMRDAEARLRAAGYDATTGLITLPVAAAHFSDVRADGARMAAVNGSILGGEIWVSWSGRCFRFGCDSQTYDAYDLIQVKA